METTIDKQSFGEAGCVFVASGTPIPEGQYCGFVAVTDITLPTISMAQAPLTATLAAPSTCTITGKTFPAGFTLLTPLVFAAASAGNLTGSAVFYKAL